MNNQLSKDALSSIIFLSDLAEFQDSGRSFIVETLIDLNCSKLFAESFLEEKFFEQQKTASSLLEVIELSGLENEFQNWCDQDENVAAGMEGIIQAIHLGHQNRLTLH